MTNVNIPTIKEIEERDKKLEIKLQTLFYKELQKLREQIIDLNDIKKVLERK